MQVLYLPRIFLLTYKPHSDKPPCVMSDPCTLPRSASAMLSRWLYADDRAILGDRNSSSYSLARGCRNMNP